MLVVSVGTCRGKSLDTQERVRSSVALIELNVSTFWSSPIRQMILWNWQTYHTHGQLDNRKRRLVCVDFRQVDFSSLNIERLPKSWRVTFWDRRTRSLHTIDARALIWSNTEDDPELRNTKILPRHKRSRLNNRIRPEDEEEPW